ncbi:Uncharacterised protein [Plesiomonas shigelloides]|uniref:hypothetical protein n=1 Tax=Plesiomonas shigelloides TaxID=703 RepID=UPI000D938AC3|nr:hypothetical protein [Plesiomonas shigelloides]SPZ45878.1 Uncharacterised protein [Plesiomonas shigelloides]
MINFIDINLKSNNKESMFSALMAAGFMKDPEADVLYHPSASLQLLPTGMITRKVGGIQVVEGVEIAVREIDPGYHANVRTTDHLIASALESFSVVVETPQYVWS